MPNRPLDELEAQVGETNETVRDLVVEAGKVAEFARAVHDPADIYLHEDVALAAGFNAIPAPPTFSRVSFFPRYRPAGVDEGFGFGLGFDREYVLHGEQRFRYERPLLVGDRLRGETTLEDVFQRAGESGGSLTFAVFRTDFYDQSDSRVLQAWNTRIETDGPPIETDTDPPRGTIETDADDGQTAESGDSEYGPMVETAELERRDFVQYAGASGDFNPIHYDEPFATNAGHPSVFGQGMLSAGVASGFVRRWLGVDALTSFRTRFAVRVFPGDALVVRGVVADSTIDGPTRTVDIEFEVTTATGNKLVVEGSASAVFEE